MQNNLRLETALSAALDAGNILMHHYEDKLLISTKESKRDIATDIDRLAENIIVEKIKQFDENAFVIAEEMNSEDLQSNIAKIDLDKCWIVDALDGTVNFISGIPFFSVTLAYIENGKTQLGVIYNPMQGDLYYASKNLGAFKNQAKLTIQDSLPKDSLFSAAFSGKDFSSALRAEEFNMFHKVNDSSRGCLRTGSASMNLALLSEGKIGGCWGRFGKIWDVAAGLLIAEESGAKVFIDKPIESKFLVNYIASTPSSFPYLDDQYRYFFE